MVLGTCMKRHRHREFLRFLREINGVVTLTSIGRIETGSAASQLQAATPAAVFHSAMALRR
jgi:hypothetical protein